MYKEASKKGLKIHTNKGVLTVEQLWTLSLEELDTLAVSLDEAVSSNKGKSFLTKKSTVDKWTKLKLDIIVDIIQTKQQEAEEAAVKSENKKNNALIEDIIARKKLGELEGKTIAELESMIKQ